MKDGEKTPLVIFGTGDLALVTLCHLRQDSAYEPVAFTVDRDRMTAGTVSGLEVIPFDELERHHPPDQCEVLVALGYSGLNRHRAEVVARCRDRGYTLGRYIGARVMRCEPLEVGENCLIFDGSIIHPYVSIGDNVVIWGQCHIGHHTVIEDHCFLASAGVSGRARVKAYTFLGAGSWVADHVTVGERNIIGAGAVITRDTGDGEVYRPDRQRRSPVPSERLWK